MKKRLFGILFGLAMAVAMLPAMAFADPAGYGVWVNGEEFTSDKLTIDCGSGTAAYDPAAGNVTLDNAAVSKGDSDAGSGYGIKATGDAKLTITLNGENSVTLPAGGGIWAAGDVEITGAGKLAINAGGENHDGISVMGNVSIKGVEVRINAPGGIGIASNTVSVDNAKLESKGLYAGVDSCGLVIENGSDVTLESTKDNCNAAYIHFGEGESGGNITLSDSKVTANSSYPGLYAIKNFRIHGGEIQSTSSTDSSLWAGGDLTVEGGARLVLDGKYPAGCGGTFTVGAASIKSDNTNEDNVPAISDSPVILEDYELTYAMAIDSEGTQIDLLKQEHGSEHLHLYKHVEFVTTERTATYGLPFTKTVKQGGSVAPGQETFSLEIFDIGNGNANEYKDVTYTASVKTNGAGDYEGVLTITGPASQVRQMVSEGFFVREVKGSAANWTYSDAVWRVEPRFDADEAALQMYPTRVEQSDNGNVYVWNEDNPAEKMAFENVYTFDDPVVTKSIPFTKTVKQGGSVAPGQETFSLEIFDIGNGNANEYKDVTYTASVKTNGAGDYEGVLTITGPASQVRQMVSEGFFVREVKGSAANWTYSDAVWHVGYEQLAGEGYTITFSGGLPGLNQPIGDNGQSVPTDPEYGFVFHPAKLESTDNGERYVFDPQQRVERMTFENIYTLNKIALAKTGDDSGFGLWLALLSASGAAVVVAAVVTRRKRRAER